MTKGPAAAGAALFTLGALLFAPAAGAGFLGDDFTLLRTLDRVGGPGDILLSNDLGEGLGAGHFYRPVWVGWNVALHGLFGAAPAAFHVANLLLYGAICVLLWRVARAVLPAGPALAAAVAFAVFPRHAESVAWVSGSTDLLAVALGLGAVLAAVRGRLVLGALLAAVALGAKEAAAVVPVLAALVLALRGEPLRRPVLVLAAAQLAVLVGRTVVLGGLGGYGEGGLGLLRLAGAAATYGVAALSPPQLELLRHPVLLLVPLALLAALAAGVRRAGSDRRRIAWAGLAWFAVGVAPVLVLPLDLNTANGERLLLLPSAGLALALGAVLPPLRRRGVRAAGALLAVAAAASCVASALDYARAGEQARALVAQAAAATPPGGSLVLLAVPVAYGTAHVFPNSADLAIQRARPGVRVTLCAPMHVRERGTGAVSFARRGAGWAGRTSPQAPFDVPVTRDPSALGPGCAWRSGPRAWPGAALAAAVTPRPPAGAVHAWWDGRKLRRAP